MRLAFQGGKVLALIQGPDAAGLHFVLVKHENGGGFMAAGLWQMTGALPVLVATLGPDVANDVNVVANAMHDRVPLIFPTGCVNAAKAATYAHRVIDHQAMLHLGLAASAVALSRDRMARRRGAVDGYTTAHMSLIEAAHAQAN